MTLESTDRLPVDDLVDSLESMRYERQRKLNTPLVVMFIHSAISILTILVIYLFLRAPINDTNHAVRTTIPNLQHQVDQLTTQVDDAKVIIDKAVTAIQYLAQQVTDLGGTPPQVILNDDPTQPAIQPNPVPGG